MVKDAPLEAVVDFGDTLDSDWLDQNIETYIVSSQLYEVRNLPILEDLAAMSPKQVRDFFASKRAPSAQLHVVVTRPEWIAHLARGLSWESAAFDPLF
jgi:hypothetical protein